MLKKKPQKPPKDLPEEIPDTCVLSVYLGGYCEEPGARNPILKQMFTQFKEDGKIALADWQNYAKENWPQIRAAHQSQR